MLEPVADPVPAASAPRPAAGSNATTRAESVPFAPSLLRLVPDPAEAAGAPDPPSADGDSGRRVIPFPTGEHRSPSPAEQRPRPSSYPAVPLLPVDAPVDATAEAWLTERAVAARAGDLAAFEAIFRALGPRFDIWVTRNIARSRPTPSRDGRPWLADDLHQEAWFALARTLETWSGDGSFLPWLLAVLPARLTDHWRSLLGREPRWDPTRAVPPAEDSHAACEVAVLIEALADRQADPRDRRLLLGHLRDGQPLVHFVGVAGDTPAAVYVRWRCLRAWLQAELGSE